jgi:eukaryotic-like serine/threonine-protein kinase
MSSSTDKTISSGPVAEGARKNRSPETAFQKAPRSGGRRKADEILISSNTKQRYVEREEIGRGGCGVVVRAFDRQMQRDVVIKRVLAGDTGSRETIRRFLNEARITGQLEHPGIVPVHEIASDESDGTPFYVMKWLKGQTLSQVIRDFHATEQGAAKRQKLHELLNRFSQVCQTLAYAHRNRVVHRDLKPSNVMVGQFGETIVLDWGLAKQLSNTDSSSHLTKIESSDAVPATDQLAATEEGSIPETLLVTAFRDSSGSARVFDAEDLTKTGSVMGTASYMSPEQARGEKDLIGTASDVFSLGVMLYEILSGISPFRSTSVALTLDRVANAQYQSLQRLNRRIPKALSAICDRAMQLSPAARYADAAELGVDIDNYLAGNAVAAFREPWWCKLDRVAAKNLVIVRSAFAALCLIAIVSLVGIAKIDYARQRESAARQLAQQENQLKQQALSSEKLAHQDSVDQLKAARRSVDTWLIDLSGDLQFYPGMESLRQELLIRAESYYQENLSTVKLETPERLIERAMARLRLGDVARLQNETDKARIQFDQAIIELEFIRQRWANDLPNQWFLQQANARLGLALCELEQPQAQTSTTIDLMDEAWQAAEKATEKLPDSLDAKKTKFRMARCRGRMFVACDQASRAVEFLEACVTEAEHCFDEHSTPSEFHLLTGLIHDQARALEASQQFEEAANRLIALEQLYTKRIALFPTRPDLREARSHVRVKLGSLRMTAGKISEAVPWLEDGEEDLKEAWKSFSQDSFFQENLSIVEADLAGCFHELGDQQRSEELVREAIQRLQDVIRREGSNLTRVQTMASLFLQLAELLSDKSSSEFRKLVRDSGKLVAHLHERGVAKPILERLEIKHSALAEQIVADGE